jgi:DNA-binding response OmpR family regulator
MKAHKILIIEDDPALLRGLKDNFEARGYHVRTANDGQKGLAAILQEPPDAVLLDLMLPKVNGYEICCAARSRRLHTPIIILTAKNSEADMLRGLQLGADDYITKPFDIRELVDRTHALCSLGSTCSSLFGKEDDPQNSEANS